MKKVKKTFKRIVALILTVVVILSFGIGYFALTFQAKATVNDYTQNAVNHVPGSEGGAAGDEPAAVLSESVKVFAGDDATSINSSVQKIESKRDGTAIIFRDAVPEQLTQLGSGDIFYLEGNADTPFGQTYIGKVKSIDKGAASNVLIAENPMFDEVFDTLAFDIKETLTADNLSSVDTAEGVTYQLVDNVESHISSLSSGGSAQAPVDTLAYHPVKSPSVGNLATKPELLFDFDIDLLKVLDLKTDRPKSQVQYANQEGERVAVYRTTTGECYHTEKCPCVGLSKFKMTLTEADTEGFSPCFLCNPPLLKSDDGVLRADAKLNLKGKVGIQNIDIAITNNFDIIEYGGFKDLGIDVQGNVIADATLESYLNLDFGGRTTVMTLGNNIKLEGLNEKLFPLAFAAYNGSFVPPVTGNPTIRTVTSAVPFTIGIMVYIDISGNVKLSSTANFNYNGHFSSKYEIIKDGQWIDQCTSSYIPSKSWRLSTELSADIDANMGCSLMFYVFNLNIIELAIAKLGVEAQGSLKLEADSKTISAENDNLLSPVEFSYYARAYLKLLELTIKLKAKVNLLFGLVKINDEINYDWIFEDQTLKEWGTKLPTKFVSNEASFQAMTASDEDFRYYKDVSGALIKERKSDGYKSVLYSDSFFKICGIDNSFIYLLMNGEKAYDLYRISKSDGNSKMLVDAVTNCLLFDTYDIYYTSDFDPNTIVSINRETLKTKTFKTFDNKVELMMPQDSNFYIITMEESAFSFLFGADNFYYLVNQKGDVIKDYGKSPQVSDYYKKELSSYYEASKMTASGYLRSTAAEIHWMSLNAKNSVLAEGVSGWNAKDAGIFTTIDNDTTPFKINLYRAADGKAVKVTDVYSNQAFFTLCQDSRGAWYFFDQTETQLILYKMRSDFSAKEIVKTFELSEISYDLSKCSMEIMDNRLYFYTIPDEKTAHMLHRYDIY